MPRGTTSLRLVPPALAAPEPALKFQWERFADIARELQAPIDTVDAVCRLHAAGLVHRFGEFVIPTHAARRADELKVGTV